MYLSGGNFLDVHFVTMALLQKYKKYKKYKKITISTIRVGLQTRRHLFITNFLLQDGKLVTL
jgi:hypothetical protein